MPNTQQLPALLKLVDDESQVVRAAVLKELTAFGEQLEGALRALDEPLSETDIQAVLEVVASHREDASRPADPDGEPSSGFVVGQIVSHRRYGYRGVVVARDETCRAEDSWYRSNRSQPDRNQPWYHVLVHDSDQVTYAAQSNLQADTTGDGVRHPLVPHYFEGYADGQYERNDEPWPGWGEA